MLCTSAFLKLFLYLNLLPFDITIVVLHRSEPIITSLNDLTLIDCKS